MTSQEVNKRILRIAIGILEDRKNSYRGLITILEKDGKPPVASAVESLNNKIGKVEEAITVMAEESGRC